MNVWEYLDRNGQCDTVVNALNNLRITQEARDKVLQTLKRYRFTINHRAKSRYGCVKHRIQTMELTSEYFTRGYELHEDRAEDHKQTLLHEAAHIIVHVIRPNASAHGREWKMVMRCLGAKPERCGQGEFLKEARMKKGVNHLYTCQKCGFEHGTTRELKNIDRRRHIKCGGQFDHKRVG